MTTPAQPEAPAATSAAADTARRSPALLLAAAAGLCWAGALGLLLSASVGPAQPPLSQPRVVFYALALTAALLTFIPIERQLRVPGLALEGVAGAALLLYTLAFVPPPTGWLLSPPDAPVYVVLAAGLFWFVSAVAIWPVYAAGTRLFRQRARQYDLRRARRQAHEAGAVAALTHRNAEGALSARRFPGLTGRPSILTTASTSRSCRQSSIVASALGSGSSW